MKNRPLKELLNTIFPTASEGISKGEIHPRLFLVEALYQANIKDPRSLYAKSNAMMDGKANNRKH
jgi:hypothetical protein